MNQQNFRSAVWKTTLGVRAKLTLIALSEVGHHSPNGSLELPHDTFQKMVPMIGRSMVSIVNSIERLQSQNILTIDPSSTGYKARFYPEKEIRFSAGKKSDAVQA